MMLNPKILNIYQESYIKKREEEAETLNYSSWLQGQYNMLSIGAAMNKKNRYPKEPLKAKKAEGVSGEEKFLLWVNEFNKRFEK